MNLQFLKLLFLLSITSVGTAQNTFKSVQNGNWNDASTWTQGAGSGGTEGIDFPAASDNVIIDHYVIIDATNDGSNFSFTGNLTINAGDTLESQVGNNVAGFVLEGNGVMRNNGSFFTLDATEEPDETAHIPYEFVCKDNSVFIGGLNSFAFISDDWNIQDNAQIFIDNLLCYSVSDDVIFDGTSCSMYGSGNIRIGGDGANSNVEYNNGASNAQLDDDITIWRNVATTDCSGTSVSTGTNATDPPPFAFDDSYQTALNTVSNQSVLYGGNTDDFSPVSGDTITLTSAGSNAGANNGNTTQGGTVTVNTNGTANDLTDDYIVYTPPNGFTGTDTYNYLITNEAGITDIGTVTVTIDGCGSMFVADTTYTYASFESETNDVVDELNAEGAPDGDYAQIYNNNEQLVLDFGQVFTAGTQYAITWRRRNDVGSGTATIDLSESTLPASGFTNHPTSPTNTNNTTFTTTIVTSNVDFRYLAFDKGNSSSVDYEIDAVGVLTETCSPDRDGDGISDENDIDDDNDGIPDVDEQLCVSYTMDWDDYFTTGEDPTTDAPLQALDFGSTTMSFGVFNLTNVTSDEINITNNRNGWYFLKDRDPIDDTTVAVIRFSSPVNNFKTTVVDIDFSSGNFRDNLVFDAYLTDGTIYSLTASDYIVGTANTFISGNLFRGTASTTGRPGDIAFSIPQPIDSVRISYFHDEDPFNAGGYAMLIADISWQICTRDTDGDGIEDYLDLDSDNDGIPDIVEAGGIDADNDGIADNLTDSDGDGLADIYDPDFATSIPNGDEDGDGIPNALDLDSDNDGIPDIIEAGGTDSDNNGVVDDVTDSDNDGWANTFDLDNGGTALEVSDSDGNGDPDYIDLDSDNDGISDIIEANGTDSDADGRVDDILDSDRDGWADTFDSDNGGTALNLQDSDNDGLQDQVDLDSDNDGIPDVVEAGGEDTNGDGILDDLTDDDNDGIADVAESEVSVVLGELGDCSGQESQYEHNISFQSGTTNATGDVTLTFCLKGDYGNIVEDIELTDEDGTTVSYDISDSDNPGYSDCEDTEFCITTTITQANWNSWNNDGVVDFVFSPDANVNFCASYSCLGQVTVSYPVGTGGGALPVIDTDNDGIVDRLDLDADNDGIPDVVESGGTDVNGDGRADNYVDSDEDGFNDLVDGDVGNDGTAENSANALILTGSDTDNDGEPNSIANSDFDGDDIYNYLDLDSDDDGILDVIEAGGTDSDRDGQEDSFADADGDGFNDNVDGDTDNSLSTGDDSDGGQQANALTLTDLDTDLDGAPDSYPNDDFDSDGNLNYLDIDADNDGITDNTEGQSTSGYVAPANSDADGDGIDDAYDADDASFGGAGSSFELSDIDSADDPNSPDYLDLDSDNDGTSDIIEGHDSDNDGSGDAGSPSNTGVSGGTTDSDNDGLLDGWDNNTASADPTNGSLQGTSHPNVTNNATVERDWREVPDRDNDGIADYDDVDDDNDGILDIDEGCPDYSSLIASSSSVDNVEGISGIPDGDYAEIHTNGDEVTIDFKKVFPSGTQYIFVWRRRPSSSGSPVPQILESTDNSVYNLRASNPTTSVGTVQTDTLTSENSFRYLRFTKTNPPSVVDYQIDAVGVVTCRDTDGDGIPDNFDLDSDNDGIPDIIEAGGVDADNDGVVDGAFNDPDNDGWSDEFDPDDGGTELSDLDTDGDGFENRIDLDADDDGIADIIEAGGVDADGDGRADDETDSDFDGWANTFDSDNGGSNLSVPDTDGDDIENYLDLDSDNDGLTDNVEAQSTASFQAPLGTDTDFDGWDDRYDSDDGGTAIAINNHEGAGNPDYTDSDTDGDGFPDWHEGFDDDESGDALNDLVDRADTYEAAAGNPSHYINSDDADSDNIPDWLEDDDSDGLPNFLDPDNALYVDSDGDGLVNLFDTDNNGASSGLPNGDADAEPDFRDLDDQISLPVTLVSFQATKHGKQTLLTWKTAAETNNDYFIIERSEDGQRFIPILQVQGNGNSNREIIYTETDENPHPGNNYYRLSQVDFDGSTERFDKFIRLVKFENQLAEEVGIYPNPSGGQQLFLLMKNPEKGKIQLEISSIEGKILRSETLTVDDELRRYEREILRGLPLSKGVYLLRLRTHSLSRTIRFIVAN